MFCITAELDAIRTCTDRGIHLRTCRDDACTGCQPREATVGHLCDACYTRLEQTYSTWDEYAAVLDPHNRLATVTRAVQHDNAGIRTTAIGYVNLSTTALLIEECESYLRTAHGHDTLQSWVSTQLGAADAAHFTRSASAAYRSQPITDRAHKLRRVRCPKCAQLSLVQKPPTAWSGLRPDQLGPKPRASLITITCQNGTCGHAFTEGEMTSQGVDRIDAIAEMEVA